MAEASCTIDPNDKRLADQKVAFLVNGMRCRLQISAGGTDTGKTATSRSSVLETGEAPATTMVTAALAVTEEKLLLDVQRMGKEDTPKEYLCVSYKEDLFNELRLEYGNSKKNSHLIFILPDAGRFLKAAELDIPEKSTIKVIMDTPKAPDVAMHVQRIIHKNMGDNCVIKPDDARIAGEEVQFLLQSMKCRLQSNDAGGDGYQRSSIVGTADVPAERTIYAALAVTTTKLVLDLKRAGVADEPKEYLNINYSDALFDEVGLEYTNDPVSSHLGIVLPDAKRFFKQDDLKLPEKCNIKIFMNFGRAPDVVMFVKHHKAAASRSKNGGGKPCIIAQDDARLASQKVEFLLNDMKCWLHIEGEVAAGAAAGPSGAAKARGGKRSSILATDDCAARKAVFAALAVTEDKLLLDLQKEGADESGEYLCIGYQDDLCKELDLRYVNDQKNSHLILVLPDAGRFFSKSASNLQVPEHATIKVCIDTWKAPDIAIFVRQRIRVGSKQAPAS